MNEQPIHEKYMRLALKEAELAAKKDEVPCGCVIIRTHPDNPAKYDLIAKAHNQVETLKDPTAHAEMIAITQAVSAVGDWRLNDTILYVTKEPCVMCAGAIVLARIPLVVFGCKDALRGGVVSAFNILNHPNLNHRCEIVHGVLESECGDVLKSFFLIKRKEP